jgi:phosphoribosylformylglycinamidine (FGAM) synthase-like amidotransferase family enzyme
LEIGGRESPWLLGIDEFSCPIAHGEGRLYAVQINPASQRDTISGFYARRLIKLEVLQEGEILKTLGSTTWAALVYEECALVRGALTNGSYYEGSWV